MYNGAMPPEMTPAPDMAPQRKKEKPMGPLVGIIIIILVLALGGLYFWGRELNTEREQEPLPFIPGDVSTSTENA